MQKTKKILMAVGRSGGHIYPAVAVAESLEGLSPGVEVHFVHSGSVIGKKIFSDLKYPVYEMSIGALAKSQSVLTKITTLFQLPFVFFKAFLLIRKHGFYCVFGTGGSVTGPILLAAVLNGCDTSIWEGNSTSGIANKYLSLVVRSVFTVFSDVSGLYKKKQIHSGYPLRKSIQKKIELERVETNNNNMFNILIIGGSQGSLFLNQVVVAAVKEVEWRKDIFIHHQTGEKFFGEIQNDYKDLKGVEAFSFTPDIYKYYKQADIIFSRGGSGVIFEVSAVKKPLVLIPLSYSAGGHQLKNAMNLYSKSSVELIREDDFNVESFKNMVLSLKRDRGKREVLISNLSSCYKKDGAETIAKWIIRDR